MKRIFQKNQIIITTLAIMIAVAGYLNFSNVDIPTISPMVSMESTEQLKENTVTSTEAMETMDISDGDSLMSGKVNDGAVSEDSGGIGEAVLTQAQVSEYIAGARLEREQTHEKTKEALNEIINNESLSEAERQEAISKLADITELIEKESAVEQLLGAKGYENAVVCIGNDSVDLVLNYETLSENDRAQIEDIVTRKTGFDVSHIIISKMKLASEK